MAARRIPVEPTLSKTNVERMKQRLRKNVASNLLRLRTEAEMSQRQLSERTEISQTYISQTEQGKRNLTLDLIAVFAVALGKQPIDLISD